ncbi:hypothetical protein [Shivajiella indica]|uniref:Uncharacterized protein n=1 Tax=Shivajiella indica TaxID=872115 RepID=A0ABW5B4P6_9BACT
MNKSLYQNSAFWLVLFFGFAVFGFWKSYFSFPQKDLSFYQHLHGISMTIWCLMLIGQAFLIRFKKFEIHHLVGKSSFVIFPILIISTFLLIHFSLSSFGRINTAILYQMALIVNATIVLVIIYGLGMYFSKDRLTHARYMVCTIFPMFTPITDRIIYNYIRPLIPLAPKIEGMPIVPFFGFLLADIIVIGLTIWDWKAHKLKDVFLVVLGLLLLYHVSVFTFYKFGFWHDFTNWFLGLELT